MTVIAIKTSQKIESKISMLILILSNWFSQGNAFLILANVLMLLILNKSSIYK
jgi:hypothetical protein